MACATSSLLISGSSWISFLVIKVTTLVSVPNPGTGGLQVIGNDHIYIFLDKFCLGIFQQMLCFHGKTTKN